MAGQPHVAVAIPAYNESEGIGEFLGEIDDALRARVSRLDLIVVDDASTDGTAEAVRRAAGQLRATVELLAHDRNQGHGPSVLEAYGAALVSGADYVLQVDGDGQFLGSDLSRLVMLLEDGADAVCGVRRYRQDPWFRMLMTRLVRVYVTLGFGVAARDGNCPLRGYRRQTLSPLLEGLPADVTVPNLFLTILAARWGLRSLEVDVAHRVRRGAAVRGTTWAGHRWSPVPWRLVRFSGHALGESLAFRRTLHDGVVAGRSA
jgi:glycosyltransferase involved in cell wall biosynthesis